MAMDFDDEFDEEYDDAVEYEDLDHDSSESRDISEDNDSKSDFDPLDITNPFSAYFSLSDDVQDDLQGSDKRKMKCLSCGHRFRGDLCDNCPECFSYNTEEVMADFDDEQDDSI